MKRTVIAVVTSVSFAAMIFAADFPGSIHFENAEVQQVLPMYKELSGLELFVDSRVGTIHAIITTKSTGMVSKAEAMKQIEKALLEQARVVVTHLDERRVSITYNDALPVVSAKKTLTR